ncbi:adenosine 3'-phospho 5'-phosphosulfate transporter 1-like isoform X1 [Macrobrachium nipponense]|uniref:adenosine 3'-phospho 5'-phosphosulfate transporter 1-like isoform X1 n=2 Tax=Macrobrachium nipponense TaxID=159736 RepID=UPI0030C8176E
MNRMSEQDVMSSITNSWVGSLAVNLLCYSTIFVPGYFFIHFVKKSKYIDRAGSSCISKAIVSFVYGHGYDRIAGEENTQSKIAGAKSSNNNCVQLIFCFVGLQVSYLTWGVLQEKVMTKEYQNADGSVGHFKDSQFLVFVNRVLAFSLAAVYLGFSRQPRHTAPIYKYSYCSFSNIMSSWCQYEALKYVSFPTQVLAKASKIIPTMIMGKIIGKKKYEYFEYVTAILISAGMTMFLLGSTESKSGSDNSTTISGVIILAGYMAFDAFTSNWQGELFSQHKMTSLQMMCGVNLFSCLLTVTSLTQQGSFGPSLSFMFTYPTFFWDCLILAVCSASGQLFIFHTIAVFGPVVFVIIMTIRQGLAILLSCILYSHPVTVLGILGIILVFIAIFMRVYCNHRLKQLQQRRAAVDTAKV